MAICKSCGQLDPDVWQTRSDGATVDYVPTTDGAFERWMDQHDPPWLTVTASGEIEFLRHIWDGARDIQREASEEQHHYDMADADAINNQA